MSARRNENGKGHRRIAAWFTVRSAGSTMVHHWALACFSLVTAFGIWFVIQDVENPRVEGLVPPDSDPASIRVSTVFNAGDYIVSEPSPVKVRVDARKADLQSLRPSDFEATADVKGQPVGTPVSVPVRVRTTRANVRILEVIPPTVTVTLREAKVREMAVNVRITGPLPDNYRFSDAQPALDPITVKVRGLPDDVDSVTSVDLDANLSGARNNTVTIVGDLVGRTDGGNPVSVQVTPSRASATFRIEQTFVQRTIGITPSLSGQPAIGFRVANVTIDPPTVTVTGPKSVVDSIQGISTEAVAITNARTSVTQVRQVDRIPNVASDLSTVLVTVEIRPIDCGDQSTACGSTVFVVAAAFAPPPPATLVVVVPDGGYSVQARVSGPLDALSKVKLSDIKATISLANATVGTQPYAVTFAPLPTGFTGLKIEADPLPVTLRAAVAP
jgi:YbbR domain-containing protein